MKVKGGGAIGPFNELREAHAAMSILRTSPAGDFYDLKLEVELLQAGKAPYKLVPCTICRRPMAVNTFYVLAWAKCHTSGCSGQTAEKASVGVAQAGRTEPSTAVNLAQCLINPHFEQALCPVHPDDPEHEMELKSVHHTDHYGPGEWRYLKGERIWVQIAKGETVLHQCTRCRATVSYSTTAVTQFRRVNEPGEGKHVNAWAEMLGSRDE